jgi:hypothetical protein
MPGVSQIGGFHLLVNGEINFSEFFAAKGMITVGPFMTEEAAEEYHAELTCKLERLRQYASFDSTVLTDDPAADNDDLITITFPNIVGEITKVEVIRNGFRTINPEQVSPGLLALTLGRLIAQSVVLQIQEHEY